MFEKPKLIAQALVGSLTKRLLGPHVVSLIIEAEGYLYAVDPEDFCVGRTLRYSGNYASEEVKRYRGFLRPASRVLVVGAHIGTVAIPLAKACKQLIAIEANPSNFDLLKKNIVLNSIQNCKAINVAASDKEERLAFLLNRANSGGSKRVPKNKEFKYYYDNPRQIYVNAARLDTCLDDKEFDLVIMDIEGSEYFSLKGMQEVLASTKALVVEFLPHHLKNVSDVSVEQFLSVISPHFSKLTIPSQQLVVSASEFTDCLTKMYEEGREDSGIIFEK